MELRLSARFGIGFILTAAAVILTAVFGVLGDGTARAAQTVPYKVNFQGRLTDNDGNALSDGLYNVKFRLYTVNSGGVAVWEEDRVFGASDNRVQVTSGLFNIQFGDATSLTPALFSGTFPLYLEVELPTPATATCASNGCASFTEGAMTPRQPLASSPYAVNADAVDGLDSTQLARSDASNTFAGVAQLFKNGSDSATAFVIQNTSNASILVADTQHAVIGIGAAPSAAGATLQVTGALSATGTINGATISGGTLSGGNVSGGTLTAAAVNGLSVAAGTITAPTVSGAITAATSANTINGLIVNAGALTGVTGLTLSSGNVSTPGNISTTGTGTIASASTVTGTTLNGSTGINTGAAAGTQRIDASGNLVNIGNVTGTGALTLQSGGAGALTLTSASGTVALGSATLQRSAASLTLDVTNALNSTLNVTNSGAGVASISLEAGGSYTGAGAVTVSSGGTTVLALDTGGAAALNIGATNATSIVTGGNTAVTLTDKVANSSPAAFTLQTAGGINLLVADTTNNRLTLGVSTTTNPTLLVLAPKSTTGDPTNGVSGAEYYNSANNKFRCDQNSIWSDCISGFNTITTAADQAATQSSTTMQNDTTLVFAANAGTTYAIDAWIPIDDSNTGADMKYTFTVPAGATLNLNTLNYSGAAATADITCNIVASAQVCGNSTIVNSAVNFVQVHGFVAIGATAGSVQFQFAQNTATAASFPVVKKGANLTWHQSN